MTDKILTRFKQGVRSLTLTPHDDGRFEVFRDGKRVYSKLQTGEFPDETAILKALAKGS